MGVRAPRAGPALALVALCAAGAALRVSMADQSFLSDELATYWDISGRTFGDLISTIHSDAEISPPLGFILSWLGLKVDAQPEWVRAPSVVAGVVTIVAVYFIGRRISGRAAGLTAAALVTFAPFMVFYSTEARGYGVMMCLVALSTLFMLEGARDGRVGWWVAYAVASCAAIYTHYTCVFVLGFQFAWLVWAHPEARRPALVANVVAALAYIPWLSGLRADLDSPTTEILSLLQPFTADAIRTSLGHWTVGYPYSTLVPVSEIPGIPALILLGLAVVASLVAVLVRGRRADTPWLATTHHHAVLVAALALAVPVSAAVLSAVGDNLFSTRNLAASWPGFGLALALLLVSAGPRLRYATAGLAVLALAIGAVKMLDEDNERPPYEEMAEYINSTSRPGDVVIDETAIISPGPLSSIDPYLKRRGPVFRSLQPQQRVRPFSVDDDIPSKDEAARRAVAAAGGKRIFLATDLQRGPAKRPLGRYRLVETRRWPGILGIELRVYEAPAS